MPPSGAKRSEGFATIQALNLVFHLAKVGVDQSEACSSWNDDEDIEAPGCLLM